MNSGTFYLYEYENNKRRRNAGFIKVARHYRSCILQIHAHSIPAGNGASMELYAFYRDNADLIAEQIAVLNCFRRNISVRLPISESHFPEGRPLPQIDGFFIRLPGGRSPLFWMASAFFFDVDMNRLRIASAEKAHADGAGKNEALPETEEAPLPSEDSPSDRAEVPADVLQPEEVHAPADILAAEATPPADDVPSEHIPVEEPPAINAQEDTVLKNPSEEPPASESPADSAPAESFESPEDSALSEDSESPAGHPSAKKIQRSDIAQLPRRFWPLANNSFLLHGYHNYNHLMLIEEEGRTWLGVPGIYAPQEARAADLFGFPRFTRSYASFPELSDEERSDSNDFGHWCRCVGTARRR